MERLGLLCWLTVVVSATALDCPDGKCDGQYILDAIIKLLENQTVEQKFLPELKPDLPELPGLPIRIPYDDLRVNDRSKLSEEEYPLIGIIEVGTFNLNDDLSNSQSEESDLSKSSEYDSLSDESTLEDYNILFRTGQNLTGDQIAEDLQKFKLLGRPITSLVLSNSRVENLSTDSFLPAAGTLRELRMDNCSLDSLAAFSQLPQLKFLNLSHNNLRTALEEGPIAFTADSLEVLDLSHNNLHQVSPQLVSFPNLRELDLSHNMIKTIEEEPLNSLKKLEVLSLNYNVLEEAKLASLKNLKQLDVSWNYLWRAGQELELPPQRLSLSLASNPWRCDCGLLEARDNHDVLDMDSLQCADNGAYYVCTDEYCPLRQHLPRDNARDVSNLTKESIEYLGCTGLSDRYHQFINALDTMKEREPEKLMRLEIGLFLLVTSIIFFIWFFCMVCSKKKQHRSWLTLQMPHLKISKLEKPQEVPYIKIEEPQVKTNNLIRIL